MRPAMRSCLKPVVLVLLLASAYARVGEKRVHRKLALAGRNAIPEQYMVRFADTVEDVEAKTRTLLRGIVGPRIVFAYNAIMKGVVLSRVSRRLLDRLLADEEVMLVEEDQEVQLYNAQSSPPWGLDRVDQRGFFLNKKYCYDNEGEGVDIYIVDTGIRSTHSDFGGRVTCGFNAIEREDCEDLHGHGTHGKWKMQLEQEDKTTVYGIPSNAGLLYLSVAGTAAGEQYGVAKSANLINVKVLAAGGRGSLSGIAAGLNYIKEQKLLHPERPAVANLSIGSGYSSVVNQAVESAVTAGVVVVVAAGNQGSDACYFSPASADSAITVGATNRFDIRAGFSSYGACVDIFAPGVSIESNSNADDEDSETLNGTSMAAPHVAGAAALYLNETPDMTPQEVTNAVLGDALQRRVRLKGKDSPNLLLHIGRRSVC